MKVDSLDELKTAFAEWRRNKKHTREPMPEELRDRARRAAEKHGVTAVVGVTRVERARLLRTTSARMEARETTSTEPEDVQVPTFSRLELGAPPAPNPRTRPIAELETGTGVTLRMYEQTPEMMRLFSAVCGLGGVG
jgi:hypothetical protein